MNSTSSSQAYSLLNTVSGYALEHVDSNLRDQRTAIEASRIACLNLVLEKYIQANSNIMQRQHKYRFLDFSYLAERNRLITNEVESLAEFLCSEMQEIMFDDVLKSLTVFDTVSLLTEIHSLGSYSIINLGTSPRILGAFYTPQEVSDYIAENTIGPVIDTLIRGIIKNGMNDYYKLINATVLDPACGSGAFLISALKVFMTRKKSAFKALRKKAPQMLKDEKGLSAKYNEKILGNLYGVDLDAGALEISKISLHLLLDKLETSQSSNNNFRRGNSLISLNGYSDYSCFFNNPNSRYPFEWYDEFPDIFSNGGFDFILMNPPYDRLKPNKTEFKRERMLHGCHGYREVDFDRYKERLREDVAYFRNSGEYKLGNKYSIDTYRLFVERSLSLVKPNGRIGFIVPSTLLGDISAAALRRELIMNNKILMLKEFPEGAKIFPGVIQSVCIMILQRGAASDTIDASFGLHSINEARNSKSLHLKCSNIETSMGKSLCIPRIANHEWKIFQKLSKNHSLESSDWLLCRRGELDLSLHKKYIITENRYSPLIRGSHISRYSLKAGSSKTNEYVNIDSFKGAYRYSERLQHIESPRIACQQISNRAQRWRLKFSLILPGTVLANSCNYIVLTDSKNDDALNYLLGILNSDLLNWRFDISNTNNHVSNRELNALPIVNHIKLKNYKMTIVHQIKKEVTKLVESNELYSPFIEGSVFYLYGLNQNEAKAILQLRGAADTEMEQTLSVMEYHIQNE